MQLVATLSLLVLVLHLDTSMCWWYQNLKPCQQLLEFQSGSSIQVLFCIMWLNFRDQMWPGPNPMKQIKPYNYAGVFFAENNIRSKIFAYSKSNVILRWFFLQDRVQVYPTWYYHWPHFMELKESRKSQTRVSSHLKECFEVLTSLVPLAPNWKWVKQL